MMRPDMNRFAHAALLLSACITINACSTDQVPLVDPPVQVEAPVFAIPSGAFTEAQSVAITCATAGAQIYFTIDGSNPDQTSTLYTSAISVDTTTTIKARAYRNGMDASTVATGVYAITDVATPAFTPVQGTYDTVQTVSIACTTPGAVIRYTIDGTDPDETSTEYTAAIIIDTTTTIKAIASRTGMTSSAIADATYTIDFPDVAAPDIDPPAGTYTTDQQVTITSTTSGAAIYYTTDGSDPTEASSLYSAAFTVSVSSTVRARAYREHMDPSPITDAAYVIDYPDVATPTFDPVAGTYTVDQTVSITTATAGAAIYYTTDGSDPTEGSMLYTGTFVVSSHTNVRARGYLEAMDPSVIGEALYYIDYPNVAQPVISPDGGIYSAGVTVTVTCATPGATIYYTTNGQTPTESDAVWSTNQTFNTTTTLNVRAFAPAMDATSAPREEYSIIPNLVAHYPFDGNGDDASGNGHHATVHGATPITLSNGDGIYEFDGVDDYIQLPDESSFDLTSFTMSFRMMLPSLPMSEGPYVSDPGEWVLFSKGPVWGNYRLYVKRWGGSTTGALIYHHTDAGGSYSSGSWTSPATISPGASWRHVTITFDGTLRIYVNGWLLQTETSVAVPLMNNDPVMIGKASDGEANDLFTGQMNSFRIYNRALTAAEVTALYSNGG
jgi:hypothetical protein